ncbi:MAG: hypothetical protein Q9182_006444 [Xanthomendoza sp. 2 TL-2023]
MKDLPSWQERAVEAAVDTPPVNIPILAARKFFAVDGSGSTSGGIMRAQQKTVMALHGNPCDNMVLWDTRCDEPRLVDDVGLSFHGHCGGTNPVCILREPLAVDQIQSSDVWVLMTDGEIASYAVSELSEHAESTNVLQASIIVIITGARHEKPCSSNISVGVSFFAAAREALIMFKDYTTGQLFILDAKGSGFEALNPNGVGLSSESEWHLLPQFASDLEFVKHCGDLSVFLTPRKTHTRAVSLGTEWDSATDSALVHVSALLEQTQIDPRDLRDLLREEAIAQLALLCKTRGRLGLLRELLLRHKQQEVIIRLEDLNGAAQVMEKIQSSVTPEEKDQLVEELRRAHAANRESYFKRRNEPSEEQREASELNKLINRGLEIIAGLEKSGYTADILNRKSNRAMRSSIVSAADSEIHLAALDLSDDINALRGSCPICCDEQIMSIVLKRLDTVEENTTDFALNFPLAAAQAKQNADIVSAQCICFQCALVCKRSIYHEDIVATIPTVNYSGANKKYIDHQLTQALTAGLKTGASGIAQLFMTILDRTLETKNWCSRSTDDVEIQSRRQVFEFTLHNLLQGCRCRETFSEVGPWVAYPQAIWWSFKNFEIAGLDSWIIQYPLAGFSQICRWMEILQLPIDAGKVEAVKRVKLIHQTVTAIMNSLLREKNGDKSWTYPFLQLIYRGFNAPGIPSDVGLDSLIPSDKFWDKLEDALGHSSDVQRFLTLFDPGAREEITSRLQLITFWALFTQKGHTTPKTFFANITAREPLAPAVLDPTAVLPQDEVKKIMLSLFCDKVRLRNTLPTESKLSHLGTSMPPFASPFGASVLRCTFPSCGFEFFAHDDLKNKDKPEETAAHGIRIRRAKHFAEIFGIPGAFNSQTGLPDPTLAPKAPTSYHNTLHISTARAWSRLSLDRKRAVISGAGPYPGAGASHDAIHAFTADVRHELCTNSHRGNIYSATIEDEVRSLLPSFLEALRVASKKAGLEDQSGAAYVHDWTKNTIIGKMEYELAL